MGKVVRSMALIAIVALAVPLALASDASAQMREFTGKVDRIGKKKLIVDNRKGDKVKFIKVDETAVSGEGKTEWNELKKGDWVTVDWKFVDKPRKAYNVNVLPPREEEGEDL